MDKFYFEGKDDFEIALDEKIYEIYSSRKDREVRQLFLANHKDKFVVNGIVNELFYKENDSKEQKWKIEKSLER